MYELKEECSGNFDCFDTSIDPLESGLAKINGNSITLGMDASQDLGEGEDRPSVELTLKPKIKNALIVLDVPKVPFGCGSESTIASQDVSSDDGAGL